MEMNVIQQEGTAVVTLIGSIDALTAEEVTLFLSEQIQAGNTQLVADLSQVNFMSSAGLRAILSTTKEIRQLGGDFRLAAAQPGVDKVLNLSGFTSILKTFSSVSEAVTSFGSTA